MGEGTNSIVRKCTKCGPWDEVCEYCMKTEIEEQMICYCGRSFYRSDTVTDECESCYELRLEMR